MLHFDLLDIAVFLVPTALAVLALLLRTRRDAERLRRSEQLYRDLVEKLPVGLYLDQPDAAATNIYSNPALVELFGYPAERWQEPDFFSSILHPDDRDRIIGHYDPDDVEPFEETYRLRAADGSYRWVKDRGVLVTDRMGRSQHVQGILLDITEQKELEAEASTVARRYRSLVENLPLVTYIEDARDIGTTVYISPQVERVLGYPVERWLHERDFFFSVLDPAYHERVREARGTEPTTQEFRLFAADGSERWIHSERITVADSEGRPLFIQGLWIDLTEKRHLEQRLAQQDRLDAVGQLAAGIAHNFNNMLVAIRGYAELAGGRTSLEAARRDVAVVVETAERAADLVRHLMAFSRRQVLEPRATDMRVVVEELLDLLRQLLGSAVQIEFEAPPGPATAHVDRAQIEQVIVNLAINARDAMPDGGRLGIRLREDGDTVVLEVSDTGVGIDPENADRIFEPFFTTKAHGSGLGLATAHGTVSQSGGELRLVQSVLDVGTTFEVRLPRSREAAAAVAA